MRYYSGKYRLVKWCFVFAAVAIVLLSLIALGLFVRTQSERETASIGMWAEATKHVAQADGDDDVSMELMVINENDNIPVILVDSADVLVDSRNVEVPSDSSELRLWTKTMMKRWGRVRAPIRIDFRDGNRQYVYYDESRLVSQLRTFSLGSLAIIVFLAIGLVVVLYNGWREERNVMWVGFSKETAHQLGTPISSLEAWIELFRMRNPYADSMMADEMEKDVARLRVIADRFSKIGSRPKLAEADVKHEVRSSLDYMRGRFSKHVSISLIEEDDKVWRMQLCSPLFAWVIENLCKNAVDAMVKHEGHIEFRLRTTCDGAYSIVVSDNGCGLARSRWRMVFKSGYTTKSRGWGLGLSFAKRIVEEYHGGRIFVKSSEEGKGTTFEIVLFPDKLSRVKWTRRNFIKKLRNNSFNLR